MIVFEILSSPDSDSIGEYSFHLDRVTIGDTKNSFLTIYESFFRGSYLELKVIKKNLYIIFKNRKFEVNEKQFEGTKLLEINDVVKLGQTYFRIVNFEQNFDLSFNLSEKITNLKKEIYESDSSRIDLILQIEDEIINHEQNEN